MSLFVRVDLGFYTHRKTLRLFARIGESAYWIPPRLWAYAAQQQINGDFSNYTPQEIALLIGYNGDATSMLQALLDCGFMDADPLRIHDWEEHNGFHAKFSQRAKKAARSRWKKEEETETESENAQASASNATSIPQALNGKPRFAIPATEQEAVEWAVPAGVPPDFSKRLFQQCMGTGFMDGVGRQITSWSHYAKHRHTQDVARQFQDSQKTKKKGVPNI